MEVSQRTFVSSLHFNYSKFSLIRDPIGILTFTLFSYFTNSVTCAVASLAFLVTVVGKLARLEF